MGSLKAENMNTRDKLKEIHRYSRLFDFEYLLDVEYNALNSFLIEAEGTINKKVQELESKIESWAIERKLYFDAPEPFDMFETKIIEINQFSSLLNNSFLIMSYSIFERKLFEICAYCRDEENEQKTVNDMSSRSHIDKCRKYLENIIGVNLSNVQNEWLIIKNYKEIRNSIAHNNGVVKEKVSEQKEFREFLRSNNYTTYDIASRTVSIESIKFISDFTELIKEYISKLLHEIANQKSKSAQNTS